jgi:hypothetical protein
MWWVNQDGVHRDPPTAVGNFNFNFNLNLNLNHDPSPTA